MGIIIEPQLVKFNVDLDLLTIVEAKSLLWEYKDVFAWSYKDFKWILLHIAQHQIELDTIILPSHQNQYRMNPIYATMVKHDLDKFLIARFITPMEEATWLLPIVVVPKKNGKMCICVDFRRLNATMKKDPYPLSFTKEVLDMVDGHKVY